MLDHPQAAGQEFAFEELRSRHPSEYPHFVSLFLFFIISCLSRRGFVSPRLVNECISSPPSATRFPPSVLRERRFRHFLDDSHPRICVTPPRNVSSTTLNYVQSALRRDSAKHSTGRRVRVLRFSGVGPPFAPFEKLATHGIPSVPRKFLLSRFISGTCDNRGVST